MGMLYTCNGKVSCQFEGTYADYHGSCTEGFDEQSMVIKFNCRGREEALKTTHLIKREPGLWKGYDWAGRNVILTYVGSAEYCERCRVWHDLDS